MDERYSEVGLVLVAHGSSRSSNAADVVFAAADRVRPYFRDVRVGLWKQQPSVSEVIATVDAHAVVVVPYFMADGWFVREAIPNELGLAGATSAGRLPNTGQRVTYTRALGSSPAIADAVAAAALAATDAPRETAVVLVGHGTPRDTASRDSLLACVRALRGLGEFAEVVGGFIDDDPDVRRWRSNTTSDRVVFVPFFAGVGPHVTRDIPEAVGLSPDWHFAAPLDLDGVRARYLWPVGSSVAVDRAILQRASEGIAQLGALPTAEAPTAAELALSQFLAGVADGPRRLGNVVVADAAGGWTVCAAADEEVDPEELEPVAAGRARSLAGLGAGGPHRAWASASDLRRGWRVDVHDRAALRDVLDLLVPAGLVGAASPSPYPVRTWASVAGEQVGMDAPAATFDPGDVPVLVERVCGECARSVAWTIAVGLPEPQGGAAPSPRCYAPCRRILRAAAAAEKEAAAT